jgi:hypothetical protein
VADTLSGLPHKDNEKGGADMKKQKAIIISKHPLFRYGVWAAVLTLMVVVAVQLVPPGSGDSSADDVVPEGYTGIYGFEDLMAIRTNSTTLSGKYVLMNDITFTPANNAAFVPIGNPNARFTGIFDGNSYEIKGMHVNTSSSTDVYAGLFGYVDGAQIRNLGVVDSTATATGISANHAYAGGIIGYAGNATTIENYQRSPVSATAEVFSVSFTTVSPGSKAGMVRYSLDHGGTWSEWNTHFYLPEVANGTPILVGSRIDGPCAFSYWLGTNSYSETNWEYLHSLDSYFYWDINGNMEITGYFTDDNPKSLAFNTNAQWASGLNIGNNVITFFIYPGQHVNVSAGTFVIIDARNNFNGGQGYRLTHWVTDHYEGTNPISNPLSKTQTFTMDGDKEITAFYEAVPRLSYSISTADELYSLAVHVNEGWINDGYFILTNDIDLNDLSPAYKNEMNWDEKGWRPIGYYYHFAGTFDGNGHKITGLWTDREGEGYIGLFGRIQYCTIKDLGVETDPLKGVKGGQYIGVLAAYSYKCTIENSYVQGAVVASGDGGGLIGFAIEINIIDCHASVMIAVSRGQSNGFDAGGLIGSAVDSSIRGSSATAVITASVEYPYWIHVGGLIGRAYGVSVDGCYAAAEIDVSDDYVDHDGYWRGAYAGGLMGHAQDSNVIDSHSSATIRADSGGYFVAGGVMGYATHTGISGCSAEAEIDISDPGGYEDWVYLEIGGLIGAGSVADMDGCSAEANIKVSVTDGSSNPMPINAGGLAGHVSSTEINGCSAVAEIYINALGDPLDLVSFNVGGLIGVTNGLYVSVSNSRSSAAITIDAPQQVNVGGLIGRAVNTDVTGCVAMVETDISDTGYPVSMAFFRVGGFIGSSLNSDFTECASHGNIDNDSRCGYSCLGGFAGRADGGEISGCYSSVNINAELYEGFAGGFAGELGTGTRYNEYYEWWEVAPAEVFECYSVGSVVVTAGGDVDDVAVAVGGFAGTIYAAYVYDCYTLSDITLDAEHLVIDEEANARVVYKYGIPAAVGSAGGFIGATGSTTISHEEDGEITEWTEYGAAIYSYAAGKITVTGNVWTGGFVGASGRCYISSDYYLYNGYKGAGAILVPDLNHNGIDDFYEEWFDDNSGPDTDGDGYSDMMEIAFGSNPNDPCSTPFDINGNGIPDWLDKDFVIPPYKVLSKVGADVEGIESATWSEMTHAYTFEGWDVFNVWGIYEGNGFPYLVAFGNNMLVAPLNESGSTDYQIVDGNENYDPEHPLLSILTTKNGKKVVDLSAENVKYYQISVADDTQIIYGDVNGDGVVNSADSAYLARYLAGWPGYDINIAAADVNGDGIVNSTDSAYLARHLAGWPGYEKLGPQG